MTLLFTCLQIQQTPIPQPLNVKDWLTLIIAAVVAIISIQQYLINKKRLRLDLFEKRYVVYKKLKDLIHKIIEEGGIPLIELINSYSEINEAEFLFDEEVTEFIRGISQKNINLYNLKTKYNTDLNMNRRMEITTSLRSDLFDIEKIFEKYLLFKGIKIGYTWNNIFNLVKSILKFLNNIFLLKPSRFIRNIISHIKRWFIYELGRIKHKYEVAKAKKDK